MNVRLSNQNRTFSHTLPGSFEKLAQPHMCKFRSFTRSLLICAIFWSIFSRHELLSKTFVWGLERVAAMKNLDHHKKILITFDQKAPFCSFCSKKTANRHFGLVQNWS